MFSSLRTALETLLAVGLQAALRMRLSESNSSRRSFLKWQSRAAHSTSVVKGQMSLRAEILSMLCQMHRPILWTRLASVHLQLDKFWHNQTTEVRAPQTLMGHQVNSGSLWLVLDHLNELAESGLRVRTTAGWVVSAPLRTRAAGGRGGPVVNGVEGRRQVEVDQDSDMLVVGRRPRPSVSVVQSPWNVPSCRPRQTGIGWRGGICYIITAWLKLAELSRWGRRRANTSVSRNLDTVRQLEIDL